MAAGVHPQHLGHAGSIEKGYITEVDDYLRLVAQALEFLRPLPLASNVVLSRKDR